MHPTADDIIVGTEQGNGNRAGKFGANGQHEYQIKGPTENSARWMIKAGRGVFFWRRTVHTRASKSALDVSGCVYVCVCLSVCLCRVTVTQQEVRTVRNDANEHERRIGPSRGHLPADHEFLHFLPSPPANQANAETVPFT